MPFNEEGNLFRGHTIAINGRFCCLATKRGDDLQSQIAELRRLAKADFPELRDEQITVATDDDDPSVIGINIKVSDDWAVPKSYGEAVPHSLF